MEKYDISMSNLAADTSACICRSVFSLKKRYCVRSFTLALISLTVERQSPRKLYICAIVSWRASYCARSLRLVIRTAASMKGTGISIYTASGTFIRNIMNTTATRAKTDWTKRKIPEHANHDIFRETSS